jgi:Lrp/AsnC family leucine-responsive transcriptional regulator
MDEIDERIVEIMTANARTSFRKIAKELERSPDTIINRFQRLKDSGDIRGSTVVVEPSALSSAAFEDKAAAKNAATSSPITPCGR